jgi:DNA-binding XRE family transcriptional regulator
MEVIPTSFSASSTLTQAQPAQRHQGLGELLFFAHAFSPSSDTPYPERAFRKLADGLSDPSGDRHRSSPHVDPVDLRASKILEAAQARLGLSKSSLARICGVTRQTIYDWINEAHEPGVENILKLELLDKLLSSRSLHTHSLSPAWAKRKTVKGVSLLEVLQRSEIDLELALNVLDELVTLFAKHTERPTQTTRSQLGWRALDDAQRERNLTHNLPIESGK